MIKIQPEDIPLARELRTLWQHLLLARFGDNKFIGKLSVDRKLRFQKLFSFLFSKRRTFLVNAASKSMPRPRSSYSWPSSSP